MKLSFKEAAIRILNEAEQPLSAKEITQIALEKELIETFGVTPDAKFIANPSFFTASQSI